MIFAFDNSQDADYVVTELNNLGIEWDIDEFEKSRAVVITYNTTIEEVVTEICYLKNIFYNIITI